MTALDLITIYILGAGLTAAWVLWTIRDDNSDDEARTHEAVIPAPLTSIWLGEILAILFIVLTWFLIPIWLAYVRGEEKFTKYRIRSLQRKYLPAWRLCDEQVTKLAELYLDNFGSNADSLSSYKGALATARRHHERFKEIDSKLMDLSGDATGDFKIYRQLRAEIYPLDAWSALFTAAYRVEHDPRRAIDRIRLNEIFCDYRGLE